MLIRPGGRLCGGADRRPTRVGALGGGGMTDGGGLISPGDSAAFLAAIVDSAEDAILAKDLDGKILYWNAAAERMYGYTAGEAVGQSVSMLVPADSEGETERI